jgi:hypothetical protein
MKDRICADVAAATELEEKRLAAYIENYLRVNILQNN